MITNFPSLAKVESVVAKKYPFKFIIKNDEKFYEAMEWSEDQFGLAALNVEGGKPFAEFVLDDEKAWLIVGWETFRFKMEEHAILFKLKFV